MVDGTTAALTPSAVSLAATWDIDVVAGVGDLLATEVVDKKADILLAPTGEFNLFFDLSEITDLPAADLTRNYNSLSSSFSVGG